jgi:hypothetical protein
MHLEKYLNTLILPQIKAVYQNQSNNLSTTNAQVSG